MHIIKGRLIKLVIGHKFHPLMANSYGLKQNAPQILLPMYKTPPSRPLKLRRREPNEDVSHSRLGKKNLIMKCSNCGQFNHNLRGCKQGKTNKVNIVYHIHFIYDIITMLKLMNACY